ncbi:hypothetical protein EVAR_56500_1 [Eumeta japonica]|uniref:SWIM-type domain-containing protein n=1 Tax=Eumeta variegata TaxID=151549 RepID=A0A4C1XM81_EUMVA|nr:hypothetical protein EVAR_56500_1 [Eumeta japonica]
MAIEPINRGGMRLLVKRERIAGHRNSYSLDEDRGGSCYSTSVFFERGICTCTEKGAECFGVRCRHIAAGSCRRMRLE